ncbi:hypothetical protein MKI84_12850 [Ancylobacter sp. A5.8]|uniref:hypothetical protein n=1 Tax=Ancylobacter gelatini TaxID=2919920 RepID=UPI001F4DA16A|nr:hypothetical protein [Ancylobacter gelatini]MCJ8143805.1 hypothetical protein [Ancylobacter gelatini]
MTDMLPEPALLGLKAAHLLAGAIGGLVRSMTRPGGSIMRHIGTAIVGTAVAGYGTPIGTHLAARWLASPDISTASLEGMVGFLLGLTGMSLCEAAIKWARLWRDGAPPNLRPPAA